MLLDRVFVSGGKAFELEYNLLSKIIPSGAMPISFASPRTT